ncbi:hypothetical protein BDZ97DRAFT_2056837 [Flammula alnicola]|nr:hypothetical protein BDZ97DRAFT_2056837 [Flammula alnicola]
MTRSRNPGGKIEDRYLNDIFGFKVDSIPSETLENQELSPFSLPRKKLMRSPMSIATQSKISTSRETRLCFKAETLAADDTGKGALNENEDGIPLDCDSSPTHLVRLPPGAQQRQVEWWSRCRWLAKRDQLSHQRRETVRGWKMYWDRRVTVAWSLLFRARNTLSLSRFEHFEGLLVKLNTGPTDQIAVVRMVGCFHTPCIEDVSSVPPPERH